jgi:hypothetical protein
MLQEVEVYQPIEDRILRVPKALKTPRASKKRILPINSTTPYILPEFDFPDLPRLPAKARLTTLTIPLPSPSSSPIKPSRRRRGDKIKEVTQEVVELLVIATRGGRRVKRRLFHDEVLVNTLVNQKAA